MERVEQYVTDRNVLFREVGRGNGVISFGIVVPATMQYEILNAANASAFAGHKRARITLQRLSERFYWPGMGTDVEAFVAACKVCKESKDPSGMNATREPLKPLAGPSEPNERVHADLFKPGAVSAAGHKYVLVITDAFSKLAELVPLKEKEAGTVARAIVDTWICRYSTPKVLVTDRGREFCSKFADELFSKLGVERRRTSAYHPQTNSSAELFNHELIKIMTTIFDVPDDPEWEVRLPTVMLAYTTAVRKATNSSPFFLIYLRDPAMPFFQLGEMGRPFYGEDWASDALWRMKEVYAYAADKINQEGERNKRLYDSASGKHQEFSLGETVYVRHDRQSFAKVKNKKWVKCWKEAIITRVLSEMTYEVQYVIGDGALGRKSIVHRNRLKGVRSQAQKDILAETQQRQEAALAGTLGASDEPDSDAGDKGGEQQGDPIWRADGNMRRINKRSDWGGVEAGASSQTGEGLGETSSADRVRVKFTIGSDEEDDDGEWTTVLRQQRSGQHARDTRRT